MGGVESTWRSAAPGTYVVASWLFLRCLGFVYLVAFLSLATQVRGLVGSDGILPFHGLLLTRRHWGVNRFWSWPTLCWLQPKDSALSWLSWGGVGLALLLILGVAPVPVLALLWLFYLSLFTVCQQFLCYQWDILLLESGFLALFLSPWEWTPHFPPLASPAPLAIWLLWWLLFRLMFWSGAVKLRSGDVSWRSFTALKYHYQTQPLPTPLAWYAHQLPAVVHRVSTLVVLGVELIVPFFILGPPSWRCAAAGLFIGLMILIQLTGNYGFFNLLGIALSLLLVDDRRWLHLFAPALPWRVAAPPDLSWGLAAAAALLVLVPSLDVVARLVRCEIRWPRPLARVLDFVAPFHLVNGYSLFAVMATWRPEIIVEGSHDGRHWRPYEFRFKPGDVRRRPRFVAPHQPRLDWQMWFAALALPTGPSWVDVFCRRLTEGSPAVLALLARNPFPESPPRYVRALYCEYFFTTWEEQRATKAWWRREPRGLYPEQP